MILDVYYEERWVGTVLAMPDDTRQSLILQWFIDTHGGYEDETPADAGWQPSEFRFMLHNSHEEAQQWQGKKR